MKNKMSRAFILFAKITGWLPALVFYKPKIYYENRRFQGRHLSSCILMSNHKKLLDFPLYLLVFVTNNIRFLIAEVLYNLNPVMNWLLCKIGGIRVERDSFDFSFMAEALDTLDNGGIVGIFPEGRLPVDGKPFPFKPSVVYMALRTDKPIVPVYTDGNYGIFRRTKVVIGDRINIRDMLDENIPEDEQIDRLTKELEARTYALARIIENEQK